MVGGVRQFEIAGFMPGVELNGLELIGAMDFCIGSLNASATLNDYDWVGQSRSFASPMLEDLDGIKVIYLMFVPDGMSAE
eukprot:14830526-Ditylum_brightwellii.AAC.1